MYVRTLESPGLGLGQPPPQPLSLMFRSKVIPTYKDNDRKPLSTDCSVYVPSALRNKKEIDVLVFFHGFDTCIPLHNFNPFKVVKNFRLDAQVGDQSPLKAKSHGKHAKTRAAVNFALSDARPGHNLGIVCGICYTDPIRRDS